MLVLIISFSEHKENLEIPTRTIQKASEVKFYGQMRHIINYLTSVIRITFKRFKLKLSNIKTVYGLSHFMLVV